MANSDSAGGNQIATALLAEFEHELNTTRRFLERVPENQLTWRPHEKSLTVGQLAFHIASIPQGVLRLSQPDESNAPDFKKGPPQPATLAEVLTSLEQSAEFVRQTLPTVDDARMLATFRVVQNGKHLLSLPRATFLRSIMFNHLYHHRGQLGVYLRLLGVDVPSSYGPSGDEAPQFARE